MKASRHELARQHNLGNAMVADSKRQVRPRPDRLHQLSLALLDVERRNAAAVKAAAAMCGISRFVAFSDPVAALQHVRDGEPIDVMLTAWDEPEREWLSFCRAIRQRDASPCPFLALVVISKAVTREHVRLARDAGVDEFLAIPFAAEAFRQRLLAILRQRRGFVDVAGYFGPCRRRGAMARMLGAERRGPPTTLIDPYSGAAYLDC